MDEYLRSSPFYANQREQLEHFEAERRRFINHMQVYSSDEARVLASARAFYIATMEHTFNINNHNKDTPEAKEVMRQIESSMEQHLHYNGDVQLYLQDVSSAAKDMNRSKQGVKSMLLSTIRWTETQVALHTFTRIYSCMQYAYT